MHCEKHTGMEWLSNWYFTSKYQNIIKKCPRKSHFNTQCLLDTNNTRLLLSSLGLLQKTLAGLVNSKQENNLLHRFSQIFYYILRQGCNHRGDRCDRGRTQIFRYLNPIPTKGGRFCPPLQRSQLKNFRGYVPAVNIGFSIC